MAVASSAHRDVIDCGARGDRPGRRVPGRRLVGRGRARQAGAGRVPRGRPPAGRRPRGLPRRRGLAQRGAGGRGGRDDRGPRPEPRRSRRRPGAASSRDARPRPARRSRSGVGRSPAEPTVAEPADTAKRPRAAPGGRRSSTSPVPDARSGAGPLRYWVFRLAAGVDRPRLGAPARRGPREPARRPGGLLLQPPELGRPVRPHGGPAHAAPPLLLRAEGGGHGRRRAEPADALDRRRPCRTGPARTTCSRRPARVRDVFAAGGVLAIAGEGRIHRREVGAPAAQRGAGLLRPAVGRARSSRSRSTGRAGSRFGGRVRVRVGEPIAGRGPPDARGRRRADRARARLRSSDLVADAPGACREPGPVRALAHRAVQRVAGGRAAAGCDATVLPAVTRARPLAYSRPSRTQEDAWPRPVCPPIPTEYRAAARRAERRADRRLGGRAHARRGDPPRRRQGRRRLPAAPPASTSQNSNGCSLPAAGRRRSSGATRRAG